MIRGLDTSFMVQVEVMGHPGHRQARTLLERMLDDADVLAIAPQVLAEFIHIVTDERRFEDPLPVSQARQRAEQWWNAEEVTHAFPNEHTTPRFLAWLREHRLGRKRLLDTLLASTYATNEIGSIVTTNVRDFTVFGCFELVRSG